MSAAPLKRLTVAYLRGSVTPFQLDFEHGKKLTIVYGENGTGKSTICDAFDFLANGKVGSLVDRGLGQLQRFWPSTGKSPTDIMVTLDTAGGGGWQATARGASAVITPAGSPPRVEILRRGNVLQLITAQAGDRYDAIRRFIDVSGVESSETELRNLIRDLTGSRNEAVSRIDENLGEIDRHWKAAGAPGPDALQWASEELSRDVASQQSEITAIGSLRDAYTKLQDYPERLKQAVRAKDAATASVDASNVQVQQSIDKVAKGAGDVIDVLEAAQRYLHEHPAPTVCPVCESAQNVAGLQQRIIDRLAPFSTVRQAQTNAKAAEASARRAEQALETLRKDARRLGDSFESVRSQHQWPQDVTLPAAAVPAQLEDLGGWLAESADSMEVWRKAIADREDKERSIGALKGALTAYAQNLGVQKDLEVLLPKLRRTLDIVQEERKAFTDEVLSSIADEVGRLYEAVHPGEGRNKISFQLDPKKRASLDMSVEFCGAAGVPPQAYFSDSHLDTLGLCVFLALAAKDDPESQVLILDDVLGSVDEPHVERLINLLYDEASKFRHCIITTHYGPWRHKLRWGWLKNRQCQFVELSRWTDSDGMSLLRSVPDFAKLRKLLAEQPPDAQLVCAKAGVILEAVLDFLTLLYGCAVPRRTEGRYTLGDLLPSIDRKLRAALMVDVLITEGVDAGKYRTESLGAILDELTRIAQARNVFGAHFNALSFALLDSDAIDFGRLVLNLAEAIADPDAGWPRNDKSGESWVNSGKTRILHPLRHPG